MSLEQPILHLVCGKIAAGKSTLTRALGERPHTVIVNEDHWLSRLYPGEQTSLADYVRNATRLRDAISAHLVDLLRAGLSVVLDFPANTPSSRSWMRTLFEEAGSGHQLHYLDVPDDVCKSRLARRNSDGTHEFTVSDDDFSLFTKHFVPPAPEEGFDVVLHRL
ncbi:AAA family ATPase [Luteibacter sp. UNCMF366Tsu5.1]|uniref:AAA family ATPase n=1 Tax=Luteibacter sp. UNCMF366Tsu5.1 TaxID=1502758 RepID=UPI0009086272|nr:ATP-binding protein [Luteibacter sp. UNCMF366Tsu5.1]SFW28027.1 Predicted kinase [Luteibacter sp. UNCMF366Tsu5.1]